MNRIVSYKALITVANIPVDYPFSPAAAFTMEEMISIIKPYSIERQDDFCQLIYDFEEFLNERNKSNNSKSR